MKNFKTDSGFEKDGVDVFFSGPLSTTKKPTKKNKCKTTLQDEKKAKY